ncbi:beta-ketoacyl-ACP synthase II [Hominibacterium faecale]|uniref:beta-ketoacyl-ACP synthase II n=1 Tax=Hominibacterium faecale TaxID=2839743 RepID=UPI0022B2A6E6|nr:beta-ketoacyl-ACP synthase II [Hominibacterium faecale]
MEKRVVITGRGAVTPVGTNVADSWASIKAGKHGIGEITRFDITPHKVKMGAEVKDFQFGDKREAKRLDLSSQLALTAAEEAVQDAGIVSGENVKPQRFGVFGGTGIGGITTLEAEVTKCVKKDNVTRASALLVPMVMPNAVAGNLAIKFNAKASCFGVVSACAAGTHSVGEAFRNVKHGYADVVLAGSAESVFTPVCFAGFANMKAMSTRTDPARCSTPFDVERDGFILGEGAGFLILEELEHALARGAKIYGEMVGYGATCDAYHITAPSPDGEGAADAMELAIQEAGITPDKIDYINAHGTGTPYNDLFETNAIKKIFGDDTKVPISSTKSMTGHLLGAAGGIETVFCVEAINDGFIPATIGLEKPDPELTLDYVPNEGRDADLTYVLSNSLGFGGHNGSIIVKKFEK